MKSLRLITAVTICGALLPGMLLDSILTGLRANRETMRGVFNRIARK